MMAVSSGAVTVGETAVALNAESGATAGTRLYVYNADADESVVLGDADVTASTGFVLGPGGSLALELSYGEIVYAVRAGSNDVESLQIMRTGA